MTTFIQYLLFVASIPIAVLAGIVGIALVLLGVLLLSSGALVLAATVFVVLLVCPPDLGNAICVGMNEKQDKERK